MESIIIVIPVPLPHNLMPGISRIMSSLQISTVAHDSLQAVHKLLVKIVLLDEVFSQVYLVRIEDLDVVLCLPCIDVVRS
jgi:hypothetical protein